MGCQGFYALPRKLLRAANSWTDSVSARRTPSMPRAERAALIWSPVTGSSEDLRLFRSVFRRFEKALRTRRRKKSISSTLQRGSSLTSSRITRDSTSGLGVKTAGGDLVFQSRLREKGHVDGQGAVVLCAGRRRQPLGHLALKHQDDPLEAFAVFEQPQHDLARKVVGDVPDRP